MKTTEPKRLGSVVFIGYPVKAQWFSLAILFRLSGFHWLSCLGSVVFIGYPV
jgi:hypothetical protein